MYFPRAAGYVCFDPDACLDNGATCDTSKDMCCSPFTCNAPAQVGYSTATCCIPLTSPLVQLLS